jgi:hypothetical protein
MIEAKQKRRWFQFSLLWMFAAFTLFCGCFALWHFLRTIEQRRSMCEQIASELLATAHLQTVKTTASDVHNGFTAAIAEFRPRILGSRYRFLRPNGTFNDGGATDDFENQLLTKWNGVADHATSSDSEIAERHVLGGGPFIYYKAFRATHNCRFCHYDDSREGSLISIIKIELPK